MGTSELSNSIDNIQKKHWMKYLLWFVGLLIVSAVITSIVKISIRERDRRAIENTRNIGWELFTVENSDISSDIVNTIAFDYKGFASVEKLVAYLEELISETQISSNDRFER